MGAIWHTGMPPETLVLVSLRPLDCAVFTAKWVVMGITSQPNMTPHQCTHNIACVDFCPASLKGHCWKSCKATAKIWLTAYETLTPSTHPTSHLSPSLKHPCAHPRHQTWTCCSKHSGRCIRKYGITGVKSSRMYTCASRLLQSLHMLEPLTM